MDFGKRIKLSIIAAVICSILGAGLFLLLVPALRLITLTLIIICLAVFAVSLLLSFLLEGKAGKIRTPVFILVIVVSVITVFCFTIYNYGKTQVFYPNFNEEAYDELSDMKNSVVEISSDGLSGWRIPAASVNSDKPRNVIMYFGGNGEDSSGKILKILENEEYAFLYDKSDFIYIDYPSYGLSEGTISEDAIRDYALRAYDIVRSLDTTSTVTVFAYSIGTGPAVYLASTEEAEINSLVLLSPYYSGCDLFNNQLDIFHGPMSLLAAYRMPVYRYAEDVTCPVTVIASTDDEIIPMESSRNLFSELTSSSANFITVEGISHNDFWGDPFTLEALENALGG